MAVVSPLLNVFDNDELMKLVQGCSLHEIGCAACLSLQIHAVWTIKGSKCMRASKLVHVDSVLHNVL